MTQPAADAVVGRRRRAAAFVDLALFLPIAVLMLWVTVRWYGANRSSSLLVAGLASALVTDVYVVAAALWLSNVVVLGMGRQTVGQRRQRLQVIVVGRSARPGVGRVLVRQCVRAFGFVLALPFWIGLAFMVANSFDRSGLDRSVMSGLRDSYGWFLVPVWLIWVVDIVLATLGRCRSLADRVAGTAVVPVDAPLADLTPSG